MDDIIIVKVINSIQYLMKTIENIILYKHCFLGAQCALVTVLQNQIKKGVILKGLIQFNDILVIEIHMNQNLPLHAKCKLWLFQ